jgi:hypothetical protein
MILQNEPKYCILDTSQFINLFTAKNIVLLNSNDFLINNGFPFLVYEHLLELSKNNNFERFSNNLCMLEAVNTFRTLKTDSGLPGSIFMLLEYEIFLYGKLGAINIEDLKQYILKDVIEYKFNMSIKNHRVLYNKLKKEAMKESLISILPSNITNPIFRKKFLF